MKPTLVFWVELDYLFCFIGDWKWMTSDGGFLLIHFHVKAIMLILYFVSWFTNRENVFLDNKNCWDVLEKELLKVGNQFEVVWVENIKLKLRTDLKSLRTDLIGLSLNLIRFKSNLISFQFKLISF